jgi:hypothetical protein
MLAARSARCVAAGGTSVAVPARMLRTGSVLWFIATIASAQSCPTNDVLCVEVRAPNVEVEVHVPNVEVQLPNVEVHAQPPEVVTPAPAVQPAPSPAAPARSSDSESGSSEPGGGGLSVSARLVGDNDGVEAGGLVHAMIGVQPWLQVDFTLGIATMGKGENEVWDATALVGTRLVARVAPWLRAFAIVSAGWTARAANRSWGGLLTGDVGVGIAIHLSTVGFFVIESHAQLRQRFDHLETRWAIDSAAGFALLFD